MCVSLSNRCVRLVYVLPDNAGGDATAGWRLSWRETLLREKTPFSSEPVVSGTQRWSLKRFITTAPPCKIRGQDIRGFLTICRFEHGKRSCCAFYNISGHWNVATGFGAFMATCGGRKYSRWRKRPPIIPPAAQHRRRLSRRFFMPITERVTPRVVARPLGQCIRFGKHRFWF